MKKYIILVVTCFLVLFTLLLVKSSVVKADIASNLFFSEYIEGSSNNKAVEIYNPTDVSVDLSEYSIALFHNGKSTSSEIKLSGNLAAGGVYLVCNSSSSAALKSVCNMTSGSLDFNGNDAVVLEQNSSAIDAIGQIGFDPGTGWGSGDTSTLDHTLVRKCGINFGDPNGSDAFDPSVEWDGYAIDDFSHLGSHSLCISTPTPTPTSQPTPTATAGAATPTPTSTPTPTPTPTPSPSSTPTPTFSPSATPTFTPSPAPTPASTLHLPVFSFFITNFIRSFFQKCGFWSMFTANQSRID